MFESWRSAKGYEIKYEVSDFGRVRNAVTGKLIAQTLTGKGYLSIHYRSGPKVEKRLYVHRLVAEAFLPNPLGLPQVNHKDLDKLNNLPANLEWATCQENLSHAHGKGVPGIWPSGDAWFDKHTWATRH